MKELKKRWDRNWIRSVDRGRLLIISPFANGISRITRETARKKNEVIINLSDNITVAYKSPNGQLDKLLTNIDYRLLK